MTRLTPQVEHVQQYYDVNTTAFARFGQGTGTGTIRRAVWGPEVQSSQAAFEYVDQLILTEVERAARASGRSITVLDLGCGLGGSLCFLAQRMPIAGVGVTISGVQAAGARARAESLRVADRLEFRHADYTQPLPDIERAQLAFSIEAFVHSPSPEAYFDAAARLLAPGASLIICDDVLTERATGPLTRSEQRWLGDFRTGWFARSLVTRAQAAEAAARFGFEPGDDVDLTSYLQLGRPRDWALRALLPLLDQLPIAHYRRLSWRGGDALQRCLRHGLVQYRYLTWRLRA